MSPFGADAAERAIKAFGGGMVSFGLSEWLGHLTPLHFDEKAAIWAAGTTGWSVLMSLASRRFGRPGTASILKEVAYDGI